jgi:aminopeptidase N
MRLPLLLLCLTPLLTSGVTGQTMPGTENTGTVSACASRLLASASVASPAGGFADANIDVTYYKLDLDVRPLSSLLYGVVTLRARSLRAGLSGFTLDLNGALAVDSVRSGGARIPFSQFALGMLVTLDRPYAAGEIFTVDIAYHGSPPQTGFGSFVFYGQNGSPWVWTLSEPYGARDWWPCKDNTIDKADSADIWITCPQGLKAGSNGLLVSVVENQSGTVTYRWAERYPIAPYLVSVTISNFVEFTDWFHYTATDSMPVLNYVLPASLAGARVALGATPAMLTVFSNRFGLYPFIREKYGHAQFGWGGAMEHQTMTSTTNFAEATISHELAHQWFGDMITCANWRSLWLNEGFATYSEALYLEAKSGPQAYAVHLQDIMTRAMGATGTLYVQDTTSVGNLFDFNRVYAKGAWVLHMLRHVVGDTLFFRSLRAYAADPRFRFRSATTEGFRSVCESVTGKDLGDFFNAWVFGEGYPQYSVEWTTAVRGGGYEVTVTLGQVATGSSPAFFHMPVDLRLHAGAWDTTVVADHRFSGEHFTYVLPRAPDDVLVDPDKWILRDILAPTGTLPAAFNLAPNYPNPFNPGTMIEFSLPRRSDVVVTVYDALGRQVIELAEGKQEAGIHRIPWEGRDASGRPVASGAYYCRLIVDGYSATRPMLLLR